MWVYVGSVLGRKALTKLDSVLKPETTFGQQSSVESKVWFFQ